MGIRERKDRERQRRKQQIIVAAKRVFSNKGYNRATMEDIAQEAELSPGTLYLYFKNKEELFASLSLRILQFFLIRVEEVANSDEIALADKLEALKAAMFDVYSFDPAALINTFHLQSSETFANLSPPLMNEFNELTRNSIQALAKTFDQGIKKGIYVKQSPIVLADIFWSTFSGVILWQASKKLANEKKDHLKETLKFAFDVFERGIKV
jgi:AcrR family transcriptional regulator